LVRVAEHLVRLVDLLELGLSSLVAGVQVRVVLAVRASAALDVGVGRRLRTPKTA
jgi:hypothetical protein